MKTYVIWHGASQRGGGGDRDETEEEYENVALAIVIRMIFIGKFHMRNIGVITSNRERKFLA